MTKKAKTKRGATPRKAKRRAKPSTKTTRTVVHDTQLHVRLDALVDVTANINRRLDSLTASITSQAQRLNDHASAIGGLREKVAAENLDLAVVNVNGSLGTAPEQLARLERLNGETHMFAHTINSKLNAMTERVDNALRLVDGLTVKLTAFAGRVDNLASSIAAVHDRLFAFEKNNLPARATEIEQHVLEHGNALEDLKRDTQRQDGTIHKLADMLDKIHAWMHGGEQSPLIVPVAIPADSPDIEERNARAREMATAPEGMVHRG